MVEHADKQATEGIAMANIGMAVLGLKYHMNVSLPSVNTIIKYLNFSVRTGGGLRTGCRRYKRLYTRRGSEGEEERVSVMLMRILPTISPADSPLVDLIDDKKITNSLIAFLCAALISPLCLVMGQPLYGKKPAMLAHHTFMVRAALPITHGHMLTTTQIWQQMAHLEMPPWLAWFDGELRSVIVQMACAERNADGWKPVVDMANRWRSYIENHPPTEDDLKFFKSRLVQKGHINIFPDATGDDGGSAAPSYAGSGDEGEEQEDRVRIASEENQEEEAEKERGGKRVQQVVHSFSRSLIADQEKSKVLWTLTATSRLWTSTPYRYVRRAL